MNPGCDVTEDDMIMDILTRVRRAMPEFTADQARAVEAEIRHAWGGTRPYIGKDIHRRAHEKARIKKNLRRHNIDEIAKNEGVSRRTLYRMLKK